METVFNKRKKCFLKKIEDFLSLFQSDARFRWKANGHKAHVIGDNRRKF